MKQEIPYFKQPDNTHCFQACLKMVLKYFFPEKDFTYKELDKISDKQKDKWTWICAATAELKNMKLKTRVYSKFDYNDFMKNGVSYVRNFYDKKTAETVIKMSGIRSEIENAKKMIEKNIFELKELSFDNIENWFKEGYMIILIVDYGTLNNEPEFAGHFVVLTGFDEKNVYVHDPSSEKGSPNRKVGKKLFTKAWKYQEIEHTILIKE